MDRWKSRGGESQRREEEKREDQRRERARKGRKPRASPLQDLESEWGFCAPHGMEKGSPGGHRIVGSCNQRSGSLSCNFLCCACCNLQAMYDGYCPFCSERAQVENGSSGHRALTYHHHHTPTQHARHIKSKLFKPAAIPIPLDRLINTKPAQPI